MISAVMIPIRILGTPTIGSIGKLRRGLDGFAEKEN